MDDRQTIDASGMTLAGASGGTAGRERAFLVVYPGGNAPAAGVRSRVVELVDGVEVTFGRSRGCTVVVDDERVSRTHTKVVRRGADILVEDLGSRNGTKLNGARIEGVARAGSGDEIGVGPALIVVGVTTTLRRQTLVGSSSYLEERLEAEVDRATRYHRPLALLMIRVEGDDGDGAIEKMAGELRRMDTLAEYGPDELAALVPEADRREATETARRLATAARGAAPSAKLWIGVASYPEDGARAEELVSRARSALRRARTGGGEDGVAGAPDETAPGRGDLVVIAPEMRRLHAMIEKIAPTPITVLIMGETGAGKEIVAEALHRGSGRSGPLVKLNCASLPETLLESELFGHERGAFTGADRRKIGYFEAASGGSLFLDELGEMPLSLQAKLLRVLETRRVTRVGGTAEIEVDVRVITATNRDLEEEVRKGRFREDLYFRVSAFTLIVPPLRDRKGEIRPLAEKFARQFAKELGQPPPVFSAAAMTILEDYAWPGNVRELRNAIERAVVLHQGGAIDADDLPARVREGNVAPSSGGAGRAVVVGETVDVRGQLADVEKAALVQALESCGGNQTRAAQKLGLSRRALIYKMEKYGLKPPPGAAR